MISQPVDTDKHTQKSTFKLSKLYYLYIEGTIAKDLAFFSPEAYTVSGARTKHSL
jgi:hypothetical protein